MHQLAEFLSRHLLAHSIWMHIFCKCIAAVKECRHITSENIRNQMKYTMKREKNDDILFDEKRKRERERKEEKSDKRFSFSDLMCTSP